MSFQTSVLLECTAYKTYINWAIQISASLLKWHIRKICMWPPLYVAPLSVSEGAKVTKKQRSH